MIALDEAVKKSRFDPQMEEAMYRTIRWIGINVLANQNTKRQTLPPII